MPGTHLVAPQIGTIILQPQPRPAEVRVLINSHAYATVKTHRRDGVVEALRHVFHAVALWHAELFALIVKILEEAGSVAIIVAIVPQVRYFDRRDAVVP